MTKYASMTSGRCVSQCRGSITNWRRFANRERRTVSSQERSRAQFSGAQYRSNEACASECRWTHREGP